MLLAMKREQDEGAEGDAPPEHPPTTQEYVDIVQVQRLLRRDHPRAFLPYNAHAHPPPSNIEDWINLWFNNNTGDFEIMDPMKFNSNLFSNTLHN